MEIRCKEIEVLQELLENPNPANGIATLVKSCHT